MVTVKKYEVTVTQNKSIKTMVDIKVLSPRGRAVMCRIGCWADIRDFVETEAHRVADIYNQSRR